MRRRERMHQIKQISPEAPRGHTARSSTRSQHFKKTQDILQTPLVYTAQLQTLHQHRANNQYTGPLILSNQTLRISSNT